MIVIAPLRPTEDEAAFKKRALRDAIICIAWLKLSSVICYLILFFLVNGHSEGHISNVLQIMVLVAVPLLILHGILLFMGALQERRRALTASQWLCLVLASYNTVLGAIGAVYFIRTGHFTIHFVLAVIFASLSLSLCTVLCHDILVIYAFIQILNQMDPRPEPLRQDLPKPT